MGLFRLFGRVPSKRKEAAPTKNWQLVDLVRSFSILGVVAAHGTSFVRPLGDAWLEALVKRFEQNGGGYGVLVFFLVSGFLISEIIGRQPEGFFSPDFRKFYVRRAGRILPLYWATILLGVLAILLLPADSPKVQYCFGTSVHHQDPWFWVSIPTFTLPWLMVFQGSALVFGLLWNLFWTLSIEEHFYFFFPTVLRKTGTPRNLVCFLGSLLLLSFLVRVGLYRGIIQGPLTTGVECLSDFDLIAMGVLLYLARRSWGAKLDRDKRTSFLIGIAGFLLIQAVYFLTSSQSAFDRIYAYPLLGLGTAGLLLGGLSLPLFDSGYLKLFSLPGKYCYGIYLLHPIVLFLCGSFLIRLNGPLAFCVFSGSTAVLAGLSFHFFEVPCNRLIRRKLGKAT